MAGRGRAGAGRLVLMQGLLLLQLLQAATAGGGLCFEKVSTAGYLNLVGHPSNRRYAVVADQAGLIQLVGIPDPGTNNTMVVKWPYLDLRSRVVDDGNERGLLSIAFHPNFTRNGRFFVSYICDGLKHPDCQGPCMCNNATNCVPSNNTALRGPGCWSNTVVAEYRVPLARSWFSKPNNTEHRRIITFARPYTEHNGGAIFFGKDGYLYISSGDGDAQRDPYDFAQNVKALLGKVLRIDVDNYPAKRAYGIPMDNPYKNSSYIRQEIFASGFRNPWRCTNDLKTNAVFCGDVGFNTIEEVNLVQKGFNYGWPRFEGTILQKKTTILKPSTAKNQFPMFSYAHTPNVTGVPQGGICVIGGYVYRAPRNACLQGKYLYADFFQSSIWVATVYPPKGQARSTELVEYKCAKDSPIPCDEGKLGFLRYGWGQDKDLELYLLASDGVYRIADLSRCGYTC